MLMGQCGFKLGLFRKPNHLLVCVRSQCKHSSMDHNYNNIYYGGETLEGILPRAIMNLIFLGQPQIHIILSIFSSMCS